MTRRLGLCLVCLVAPTLITGMYDIGDPLPTGEVTATRVLGRAALVAVLFAAGWCAGYLTANSEDSTP